MTWYNIPLAVLIPLSSRSRHCGWYTGLVTTESRVLQNGPRKSKKEMILWYIILLETIQPELKVGSILLALKKRIFFLSYTLKSKSSALFVGKVSSFPSFKASNFNKRTRTRANKRVFTSFLLICLLSTNHLPEDDLTKIETKCLSERNSMI